MKIKKFRLRYLIIVWLIIYILISLFKYIKIKTLIYNKYGLISKTFSTRMYINESIIVDSAMLIIGFPVLLLSGGWNFTQWAYSDVKFDFSQKLTTYIELKPKFMQNKFQVTMRGGKVVKDTFSQVLATDPKFQHLYSEWVKKEVGIEDENVELEFSCGGIDFLKIEHLSEDMAEIFKNAKMHCKDVKVYNLKDLNFDNSYSYALEYKERIADKVFDVTGVPEGGMTTWIHLYSSDEYSGEQYYFKYKSDNASELLRSKV